MGFGDWVARYKGDSNAFGRWWKAYWACSSLNKKKKAGTAELKATHREIGRLSAGLSVAEERKSFGSVKESEGEVAERETVLAEREAEAAAIKARLDERTAARLEEIGEIEGKLAHLTEARKEAAAKVAALQKDAKEAKQRLDQPPEKDAELPPRAEAETKLAAAQEALPAAEETLKAANAVEDEKSAELKKEKDAWREEEKELKAELKEKETEVKAARQEANDARGHLESSFEDLGQSMHVAGAGSDVEALLEPMRKADELKTQLQETEEAILKEKEIILVTKKGAGRFAMITGGAIFGVTLLIVILAAI